MRGTRKCVAWFSKIIEWGEYVISAKFSVDVATVLAPGSVVVRLRMAQ